MKDRFKKLIDRLSSSIKYAEKEGEDMNSVSWAMQEGILISYNEAKIILQLLESDNSNLN